MDEKELIKRAWDAVNESGIPEQFQGIALKEAVDYLRAGETGGGGGGEATDGATADRGGGEKPEGGGSHDEDGPMARLASESGVPADILGDVIRFRADGTVSVTQPARKLGDNTTQRARNVTALVAGARAYGLGERPVDAAAVRVALEDRGVWESKNFVTNHLNKMAGFRSGDKDEILAGTKWLDDFIAAVTTATDWTPSE